jgi:PAS domain S-box-containing protein
MFKNINTKLNRKFSVVFGVITITVSTSYLLNFWFNSTLKSDAVVTELAAQNKIAAQKMEMQLTKLYYANEEESIETLKNEIQETSINFRKNLAIIKQGGDYYDEEEKVVVQPALETTLKNEIAEIESVFGGLMQKVTIIIEQPKYLRLKALDTVKTAKVQLVNPIFEETFTKLNIYLKNNDLISDNQDLLNILGKKSKEGKHFFVQLMIFLLVTNVSLIFLTYLFLRRNLMPIEDITDYVKRLSDGELPTDIHTKSKDEINEIALAVNKLGSNINAASSFAASIGSGNLETDIEVFNNKGKLSESLRSMRDSLVSVADEEAKRNWATEGFAKFVDIIRSTDNIEEFYNNILGNLIRYLKVNQGYLYILNDQNTVDPFMEVQAVYAYGKKKYLEDKKTAHYKEGLIGQAWFDKEALYFTEIPENYVHITSGVGESLPKALLIVPLVINEIVVGAIEIASFKELHQYEIDFVFKLGETIAGAIQNVKVSERTRKLLSESQEHTEQMRAQEEEIRQNMEEMQATQEEMERAQRAMKQALDSAKIKEQEAIELQEKFGAEKNRIQAEFDTQLAIINATAIVSKTDLRGHITYVNDMFCEVAQYTREELLGKNHNIVRHPDMPAEAFEDVWRTISSGNIWKGQVKNKKKDGSYYWVQATISPILGENGKPVEYMAVRYLITDLKDKEENSRQMVEELHAQEEEIKQNFEEMQATTDKLEAVIKDYKDREEKLLEELKNKG